MQPAILQAMIVAGDPDERVQAEVEKEFRTV